MKKRRESYSLPPEGRVREGGGIKSNIMGRLRKIFGFLAVAGGIFLLSFNIYFYNLFINQNKNIDSILKQQGAEAKFRQEQFIVQQQNIADFQKDLMDQKKDFNIQRKRLDSQVQKLSDQDSILKLEKEKRLYLERENNKMKDLVGQKLGIISQSMEDWKKDFVGALNDAQKKTGASQEEINELSDKVRAINISEINYKLISLQAAIDKIASPKLQNAQEKEDVTASK